MARLWAVVLLSNMAGALAIAWTLGNTAAFQPEVRNVFVEIAREASPAGFGVVVLRGIFAGWLLAMLVWVLPFAETARFFVVVAFTWLLGLGGFAHVVAGAVDVFLLTTTGLMPWHTAVGGFLAPALLGNIIGGVTLVAVVNHAQVVS